jgi:hypothetical protein
MHVSLAASRFPRRKVDLLGRVQIPQALLLGIPVSNAFSHTQKTQKEVRNILDVAEWIPAI